MIAEVIAEVIPEVMGHGVASPDQAWRTWLSARPIPPLEPIESPGWSGRILVVAPHPDDEVLGCGGLLAVSAARHADIGIVAVSDGEASHPGDPAWTPQRLAAARRSEHRRGLARLGVLGTSGGGRGRTRHLGLPDGNVAAHRDRLADALRRMVAPADVVVTTWRGDGHPDHEATGAAAAEVCTACGARLLEMPVWMWNWSQPDDARVPWHRLRAFALPPHAVAAKRAALAEHATQLAPRASQAPVLAPEILSRASRDVEYFFV